MTAAENARARGVTFDEAADDLRRRAVELERRAEIERLQARVAELEAEVAWLRRVDRDVRAEGFAAAREMAARVCEGDKHARTPKHIAAAIRALRPDDSKAD
jgi:hypothetical protein